MSFRRAIFAALALTLSCAADEPAPDPFAAAPRCTSALTWNENLAPAAEMFPGRACIACHADDDAATGGDAPIFTFAGTVYPSGHEPDGCLAPSAEGAVVEVVDATGRTIRVTVGATGNFHAEAPEFTAPYTASVSFQGRTRRMDLPQSIDDCNFCHTQGGTGGAPGRILLP